MKIGMMCAWNSDSGASIHAELIGRSWVKLGHELKVFSFYKTSFHGTAIVGEDEPYVTRCFTTFNANPPILDARPILTSDYEIFVAQDHGMFPNDLLAKIFHWIKKKAKTVCVIHDNELKSDPSFYQFDWDAIVCFDERYYDFLKLAYPKDKLHIIPYPCYEWQPKEDKSYFREKLKLPIDKKIIFLFGPASFYGAETLPAIVELGDKYPIHVVVVTKSNESIIAWRKAMKRRKNVSVEIRESHLKIDELYEYLYASDLTLYNKPSAIGAVVSSMAYQCIGSGIPIVAYDSNFLFNFGDEIMKYKNYEELKSCLISVFEKDARYTHTITKAKEFAHKNNGIEIAKKYIELFNSLQGDK